MAFGKEILTTELPKRHAAPLYIEIWRECVQVRSESARDELAVWNCELYASPFTLHCGPALALHTFVVLAPHGPAMVRLERFQVGHRDAGPSAGVVNCQCAI